MEGVVELAEEIFHMPVRLGAPANVRGLKDIVDNPIYSTGVGLLIYGQQQEGDGKSGKHYSGNNWWDKVKTWFNGNN